MISRLAVVLMERNAAVVRHEVFGSIGAHSETIQALCRQFANFDWPVMWVEDNGATGRGVSGMHVFAVVGTGVRTIYLDKRPIGRAFYDGSVRHCLLADVKSTDFSASKPAQAQATFEKLENALHEVGMNIRNLVRTWFYLDDILSWYKSFNAVRNEFYRQKTVFSGLIPASTGVGGRNPSGAAVVAGAWAAQATENPAVAREVPSPLQCPSLEYGSAFSRAVLLNGVSCRRLLVSGTASIDPNGRSAHVGNLQNQIGLTMEVVETLLGSHGFHFSDVVRATAYFKNILDAGTFDAWRTEHDLKFLPLVEAQADMCRGELLYEIELDAISHLGIEADTKRVKNSMP
jgi:enamine deaminase RidA (YjgF/YER057c/UK114 family)